MASSRVEKFERQMQRDLGEILRMRQTEWFMGAMVTVSVVNSSPDLGYIKCYVSIFPNPKSGLKNPDILDIIHNKSKEIRMELAKLNRHLRKIPEIQFFEDKSLEYVTKMEQIFAGLNKPQDPNSQNPDD